MSLEFRNVIANDVIYIEHQCNIVEFLMDVRTYEVLLPLNVRY